MLQLIITGAGGFLGARLARTLLQRRTISIGGAAPVPLGRLVLTDVMPLPDDLASDRRVVFIRGELRDMVARHQLPVSTSAGVVHLAAAVSRACEADLDLGLTTNIDGSTALLQAARKAEKPPVFVFSSSIAVFGGTPGEPLPYLIEDGTLPRPQSSYGIQKYIGEQLVADFTRRGIVRGRSARLMTVAVRPGRPNGAASSFLSGMIREPLAGQRARVPVAAATPVALSSPAKTVEGLLRALDCADEDWGERTGLNLPALSTTVGEIADALRKAAGDAAVELLDWQEDPVVRDIVTSWPSLFDPQRARRLGLLPDASVDWLIQQYLEERPQHTATAQGVSAK